VPSHTLAEGGKVPKYAKLSADSAEELGGGEHLHETDGIREESDDESDESDAEAHVPMAVQVHTFDAGQGSRDFSELTASFSTVEACYDAQFWEEYHRYFEQVVAPMAPSPILATAAVRTKHKLLARAVGNLLKDPWMFCERQTMNALLTMADVFIVPSERSVCLINHAGAKMRLRSKRDTNPHTLAEPLDILSVDLPPFQLHRYIPEGESGQQAEITFEKPIRLSTPLDRHIERAIYATGVFPSTDSELNGRLQEVSLARSQLHEIQAEKARLDHLLAELRTRAKLDALTRLGEYLADPLDKSFADAATQCDLDPVRRSSINPAGEASRASHYSGERLFRLPEGLNGLGQQFDMDKIRRGWEEARMKQLAMWSNLKNDLFNPKEASASHDSNNTSCCGCWPWRSRMRMRKLEAPDDHVLRQTMNDMDMIDALQPPDFFNRVSPRFSKGVDQTRQSMRQCFGQLPRGSLTNLAFHFDRGCSSDNVGGSYSGRFSPRLSRTNSDMRGSHASSQADSSRGYPSRNFSISSMSFRRPTATHMDARMMPPAPPSDREEQSEPVRSSRRKLSGELLKRTHTMS